MYIIIIYDPAFRNELNGYLATFSLQLIKNLRELPLFRFWCVFFSSKIRLPSLLCTKYTPLLNPNSQNQCIHKHKINIHKYTMGVQAIAMRKVKQTKTSACAMGITFFSEEKNER